MAEVKPTKQPDAPFVFQSPPARDRVYGETPFWGNDPSVLFKSKNLIHFFPSATFSAAENLNSIVRLLTYLAIFLVLYSRNAQYLLLPVAGLVLTFVIYRFYPRKPELFKDPPCAPCSPPEKMRKRRLRKRRDSEVVERECVRPTVDNPFMNFNYITDSYENKDPGCKAFLYNDPQSVETRREVESSFNSDLYRDVSDLYGKRNSQRQYFTMPWTTWPNDQTSFAKWLYRTGPTCKELGVKCAPYWNPYASYSLLEQ